MLVSSKKSKTVKIISILDCEQTPFDLLRQSYNKSEFIPNSLISTVMSHHFPSSQLIHQYSDSHNIYKIQIGELLVNKLTNWEYNRPPDMLRCPDIARYIYNSRKPIDTMIYLSYKNINDIFEVLDGIHRLTSLKIIKEENSKPTDILYPSDFGSNNDAKWLYNNYLLVNIRFNTSLGELIETFKNLNKSQAVPDLYIRDLEKEKRQIIEMISNEWQVKYKKHFSSTSNPIIGNTNRNKFTDLLDKIYDKYKIDETCVQKLSRVLNSANSKISYQIPTKASVDVRLKCKETGCYLFLFKNDKLEDFI